MDTDGRTHRKAAMSARHRRLTGNLLSPGMYHRELRPLGSRMTSRERSTLVAGPDKAIFGSPAARLVCHLQTDIKLSIPIPFDHTCGLEADVTVLQMIQDLQALANPELPVQKRAYLLKIASHGNL
jgi:hypothetical protein